MKPGIVLLVIGLVLGVGAIASAKGSVGGGYGPDEPKVPVPTTPLRPMPGVSVLNAYRYRGMFIAIVPVLDEGYRWYVFQSLKFDVAPIAQGGLGTDVSALSEAMVWIDTVKGV